MGSLLSTNVSCIEGRMKMRRFFKRRYFLYLLVGFVGTAIIGTWIHFETSRTEPYQVALRFVSRNSVLGQTLGSPVNSKLWPLSNLHWTYGDQSGSAHIELLATGSTQSGTVILDLTKSAGVWTVTTATLRLTDRQTEISLLEGDRVRRNPSR